MSTQLTVQYAGRALPNTEQAGLGGPGLVRGYFLSVGSFDDAVVLRNELHGPSIGLPKASPILGGVVPFAFIDVGYGRNYAMTARTRLASAGVGADVQVRRLAAASLNIVDAVVGSSKTRAGDWRLEASVNLVF